VGWVKAWPMEGEVFTSQGSKNFMVDTLGWFAWEGIKGSAWGRTSKIDQNWEGGRQGRIDRDAIW